MTWIHILIEIGGYAAVMAGLAYAWALLDSWFENRVWRAEEKAFDQAFKDEGLR